MTAAFDDTGDLARSYLAIRKAIGWLGLFLPVSLLVFGLATGDLRASMSEFYFTGGRDLFVGTLVAIGVFFLAYKGYRRHPGQILSDRWVARTAGVAILGVALIPASGEPQPWIHPLLAGHAPALHYASAALFFTCLFLFSFILFRRGAAHMDAAKLARNRIYAACGIVILATTLLMALIGLWTRLAPHAPAFADLKAIFLLESIGVIAFAISWLTKGEDHVLAKRLERQVERTVPNPS